MVLKISVVSVSMPAVTETIRYAEGHLDQGLEFRIHYVGDGTDDISDIMEDVSSADVALTDLMGVDSSAFSSIVSALKRCKGQRLAIGGMAPQLSRLGGYDAERFRMNEDDEENLHRISESWKRAEPRDIEFVFGLVLSRYLGADIPCPEYSEIREGVFLKDPLTLVEYDSYEEYAQKVYNISIIFSVFFVGVSVLVISTTMTRLAEEERSAIGCYKTLGYDDGKIMFKYLFFSMFSCIIGSLCGFLGITNLLVYLICKAFSFAFRMPPLTNEISWVFGGISVFCMLAAVLLVTWRVVSSMTNEKPAALLRPKSPKPGKKILLERIGFIWKRMSFKYKSTYRNLFRYARNFILTVVSIAGSTALVFAGLGLYDSSIALEKTEGAGSTSSMTSISAVLIVCAALLSILVIYNLTNINIEERKREIATLKVLGYKSGEVCGYIFREITVLSVIGTALGIPLGYGFSVFVFNYVDFGSIADMHWYSWLGTAVLSLLFSVVVMALLCRKIIKTDMNASLKTVD